MVLKPAFLAHVRQMSPFTHKLEEVAYEREEVLLDAHRRVRAAARLKGLR